MVSHEASHSLMSASSILVFEIVIMMFMVVFITRPMILLQVWMIMAVS